MRFNPQEIAWARRLHAAGLPWAPAAGHFIYDLAGVIATPSPFQERVHIILDLRYFVRQVGAADFRNSVFWLPTWHHARDVLRNLGVGGAQIAAALVAADAFDRGTELIALYELIAAQLPPRAAIQSAE